MMHKRPRTDAELRRIATELRKGWVKGDPVALFLRGALPAIDRLVHENMVSLTDVAAALVMAGITYRPGRPWTAKMLRTRLSEARAAQAKSLSRTSNPRQGRITGEKRTEPDVSGIPREQGVRRVASRSTLASGDIQAGKIEVDAASRTAVSRAAPVASPVAPPAPMAAIAAATTGASRTPGREVSASEVLPPRTPIESGHVATRPVPTITSDSVLPPNWRQGLPSLKRSRRLPAYPPGEAPPATTIGES